MTPLARYLVETVVTLLAIAGLSAVVLYAARRAGVGKPLGPLSLAGRLVLDARRTVYLIRVGEAFYLVGASEAGLTKLGELTRETVGDLGQNAPTAPRAFKDFLERTARRHPEPAPDDAAGEPREP